MSIPFLERRTNRAWFAVIFLRPESWFSFAARSLKELAEPASFSLTSSSKGWRGSSGCVPSTREKSVSLTLVLRLPLNPEASGPSFLDFEFDTVVSPLSAVRNRSEDTKKASSPEGCPLVYNVKMQKNFLGEDAKGDKKRDSDGASLGDKE